LSRRCFLSQKNAFRIETPTIFETRDERARPGRQGGRMSDENFPIQVTVDQALRREQLGLISH
jgi:hypothetical protein